MAEPFPTLRPGDNLPRRAAVWNRVFRSLEQVADLLDSTEATGSGIDDRMWAKTDGSGLTAAVATQMGFGNAELYLRSPDGNRQASGVTIKVWNGFTATVGANAWIKVERAADSWEVYAEDCP